jgi:acetone carboxylase gamma subunit
MVSSLKKELFATKQKLVQRENVCLACGKMFDVDSANNQLMELLHENKKLKD